MPEETTISVPSEDVDWFTDRLTEAGLAVLDTGRRVTTEEGPEAEAVLCVAELPSVGEAQGTTATTRVRP